MDFLISWSWCSQDGVRGILSLVKNIIGIMRIIVPIVLIVMTTIDIFNKVINPDDKEGQQKIARRVFAGIIVFSLPLIIKLVFKGIDTITNVSGDAESILDNCWPE